MKVALRSYYRSCELVLSPSRAADRSLVELGVDPDRIRRWGRGTNLELFRPDRRGRARLEGEIALLYAGRLSTEKGIELLADGYLRARERDSRLHLSLCGGGPEEDALRERLGDRASFLGWQEDVGTGVDVGVGLAALDGRPSPTSAGAQRNAHSSRTERVRSLLRRGS